MKVNKQKNKTYKKSLAIIVLLIVLAVLGFYLLIGDNRSLWLFNNVNPGAKSENSDSINYASPTKEEVEEGQDAKRRLIDDRAETEEKSTDEYKQVNVGVTFSEVVDRRLEIRAFTPSAIEGDGVCTANLQKGKIKVTESSPAFIDSTTTQCQPIFIPIDKFSSKGVWYLVVSYKSSQSIGESSIIEVNI